MGRLKNFLLVCTSVVLCLVGAEAMIRALDGYAMFALPLNTPTGPARVGDALVANVDNASHMMTVTRNGVVEKTFPVSLGMPDGKHETKNGTYYVLEKFPDVIMDSSTYGVPVDSAYGYKLKVQWAVRIDNSGAFVHSAPWSVADQGKRNVTHGCINLGPDNAKWFYDNFGSGDPVIVKNSVGLYNNPDGADDWQWTLY